MLGGSPMRVAVPPTLEAKASGISRVRGLIFRVTAISMVTGSTSSMVVTLSRKAEMTAVTTWRTKDSTKTLPRARAYALIGQELKHAGLFQHPHKDHHAQEQEDDVQVDGPHGVVKGDDVEGLVPVPQGIGDEHDEGRAQKGDQGAVHPLERDDHVNQQQDEGGDPEACGDGAVPG